MKILVGLGNPGREHLLNRHNLGFLVVDAFVLLHGTEFRKQEYRSDVAKLKIGNEDILVMKPQTYMNRSGDAVSEAMQFYKVSVHELIVIHDELDIPSQSFRIKKGGGHGGHNGLRSIMHMGDSFLRFRMGIGRPAHPSIEVANYVLGNLGKEELEYWEQEMKMVAEAIDFCLLGKVETAMNKFNRKN